jgi:hypothetical protein
VFFGHSPEEFHDLDRQVNRQEIALQPVQSRIYGFKNLTSLELYSLSGDLDHLTRDIANILLDSPHLTKLGLSLACEWHVSFASALLSL